MGKPLGENIKLETVLNKNERFLFIKSFMEIVEGAIAP